MTIGKRISELRKKYSYSQEYIASQLGVSRQAVSKWETDQTAPDTNNLIALAKLFDVSVEYLAIGNVKEEENIHVEKKVVSETRRIIGYIFLGVGMMTGGLGLILFKELLYLAALLIFTGILCIVVKKHFVIIITCVYAALFGIFSRFIIGAGTIIFSVLSTILLVLLIIVIVKIIKKVLQK